MKFCFSFGIFDIKYFFFCFSFIILEICINFFIYNDNNLFSQHILLDPFCYYSGFLLNIFLALIYNKCSKTKSKPIANKLKEENTHSIEYIYNNPYDKYLSKKDFIKFFGICLFLIITDLIEIIISQISKMDDRKTNSDKKFKYEDDYLFYEFSIIFILPLLLTDIVYYRHQKISFIILSILELTKSFYFNYFDDSFNSSDFWIIVLNIISAILFSTYFVYIKGLMKYKFISPYKCCYMIGMINVPLIIIIYFILSLIDLGNCNSEIEPDTYCINIIELFKSKQFTEFNKLLLITFILIYGILMAILTKTINDFSIYHLYVPLLIENFLKNIINLIEDFNDKFSTIFLIICFFIELIMILIFLELIEVKFCGLNKNLKKNIELRAMTDATTCLYDYNNEDYDDERNSIEKDNNIIN